MNKTKKAALILGVALLTTPNLTACDWGSSNTCQTLTVGGRGGGGSRGGSSRSRSGSGTTKTKPKAPPIIKPGGTHIDDDCDDD